MNDIATGSCQEVELENLPVATARLACSTCASPQRAAHDPDRGPGIR
ncbi:hypothetical protein [Bradyrhizobium forestalis]|nr:hypothetical protein [Bradyrhizobium forestalis]